MSVSDILSGIGSGLAKAGAVASPILERTAQVESGEAPQIDAEQRQRQTALEDAAIETKAKALEDQLQLGQKYGTLTPDQQQQYVDQITGLYSHPRHAGTLMEKLRKAIHPNGAYAQGPEAPLPNATPPGGTAAVDEQAKEREAAAKYHARPATPQQQFYDSFAKKLGLNDSSEMSADQWEQAFKSKKTSEASPVNWRTVKMSGNVYAQNPRTLEMKFIGKDSEIVERRGVANVTVGDPPHLIQIPTVTYTSKVSGQPIVDEDGSPLQTADDSAATVAGATPNPSTPEASGNKSKTPAKKVSPGSLMPKTGAKTPNLPGVGNLPKGSRDLGQKGLGSLQKSEVQQYTKAAEDARGKKLAFENAQGLLNDKNRKTDLELVYAWVRSNVQGAGRMTNTEIQQTATAGSWGTRIQNALSQASTGRLAPEMEQQFFGDIKRSYENSQKEADDLKKTLGGQDTPPPPSGGEPKVLKFNPATGKLE